MEPTDDLERRISGIAALDQPLRRDLYRLLADRDGWVTRDEAAEALGVARSVAAFHLDKLADAGAVEITFERTTGRTGPGAGRPAKLYRRGTAELSVSVPDRRYDLAGSLLATAIAESERTGRSRRRLPDRRSSGRRPRDR
jgi:predicted ArsR family transcriptional regulator